MEGVARVLFCAVQSLFVLFGSLLGDVDVSGVDSFSFVFD